MVQKLKFAVYDIDNETSALGDDDFLGDMECNLGQVCKILLTHFTELISTEVNFHIDSVTPFHSTILLQYVSSHPLLLIYSTSCTAQEQIALSCYLPGYFFGLLAVSTVRFACG